MGSRNGKEGHVSSSLPTEEKISNKRHQSAETLTTSPSLPVLPFDLIPEILCRLPVKLLMQFRCVCKWWNSLITDSKFAKKHLRCSTTCLVHSLTYSCDPLHRYVLMSNSLDSAFKVTTTVIALLEYPSNPSEHHYVYFVGSCNGILCLAEYYAGSTTYQLWNPSIRKFKELPPLEKPRNLYQYFLIMQGFGYDAVTNNYKVVVVLNLLDTGNNIVDTQVKVHTLGTSSWKTTRKFPIGRCEVQSLGKFVSGTINWLVHKKSQRSIAYFDLGNDSYQEVLLPDYGQVYEYPFRLGVLRDCLSVVYGNDVWVLKERGNKESWTKLFTISFLPMSSRIIEVVNIFEDDQMVLMCSGEYYGLKWIIYNSKNNTFEFTELGSNPEVCLESLISPCS